LSHTGAVGVWGGVVTGLRFEDYNSANVLLTLSEAKYIFTTTSALPGLTRGSRKMGVPACGNLLEVLATTGADGAHFLLATLTRRRCVISKPVGVWGVGVLSK